ncbi:FG-GAP repeat-containing protein [Nannocystis exedens]|uniref:FG-GAP repeat-containing protein n=2 Tax=Nannocystis exedens TaxID=54 RepID=A0A1I2I1D3_9BACT|nr:hypothetical protein NAEX_06627 [Nannocystis exedens]SFF35450.1 FG-GAP repeat-containing protein [Nannocystis exedens]
MFSRLDQTWQQDAYIKAPNAEEVDVFGRALALSGNGGVLVVGAQNEEGGGVGSFADPSDNTAPNSGAAYVFTHVNGAWMHRHYLKAPNSHTDCQFGAALGLTADGSTLVIAAPHETSTATGIGGNPHDMAGTGIGAVYIY